MLPSELQRLLLERAGRRGEPGRDQEQGKAYCEKALRMQRREACGRAQLSVGDTHAGILLAAKHTIESVGPPKHHLMRHLSRNIDQDQDRLLVAFDRESPLSRCLTIGAAWNG